MVRAVRWGSVEGTSASPQARRHLPAEVEWSATWRPEPGTTRSGLVGLDVVDHEHPAAVRDRDVGALAGLRDELLEERPRGLLEPLDRARQLPAAAERGPQHVAVPAVGRGRRVAGLDQGLEQPQGGRLVDLDLGRDGLDGDAPVAQHRVRVGLEEHVEDLQAAGERADGFHGRQRRTQRSCLSRCAVRIDQPSHWISVHDRMHPTLRAYGHWDNPWQGPSVTNAGPHRPDEARAGTRNDPGRLSRVWSGAGDGAPGGIRTHDPQLRKLVLYPLSYGRPM